MSEETLPIQVYSHSRSGTNWLLATLFKSFRFPQLDGEYTTEQVEPGRHVWQPLHGSHLLPRHHWVPANYLYIWRDGRDVMVSLWNWKSSQLPSIQDLSFSEFLRLQDGTAYKNFGVRPDVGPLEHWLEHVTAWLSTNVFAISYDDLHERPEETLATIEGYYGLERRSDVELEMESAIVGYNPGKGRSGTWREVFSDEDLEYYHSVVPADLHLRSCVGEFTEHQGTPNTHGFRQRKRQEREQRAESP